MSISNKILNISSQYQHEVLDSVFLQPIVHDLDGPPTLDDLLSALGKLKKGKAGGSTGIVPELILYGGAELLDRLLELLQVVWREGTVVGYWKKAGIVPIPKMVTLSTATMDQLHVRPKKINYSRLHV